MTLTYYSSRAYYTSGKYMRNTAAFFFFFLPSIYKGLTRNLGFVWEASSTLNFRLFGINPLHSGLVFSILLCNPHWYPSFGLLILNGCYHSCWFQKQIHIYRHKVTQANLHNYTKHFQSYASSTLPFLISKKTLLPTKWTKRLLTLLPWYCVEVTYSHSYQAGTFLFTSSTSKAGWVL